MKKKFLAVAALLLSASLLFGAVACTGNDNGGTIDKAPLDNTDDTFIPGNHYNGEIVDEDGNAEIVVPPDTPDKPDQPDQPEQPVVTAAISKIAIQNTPTQTEYWVGDTLSIEGGVILATYKDKTTKEIPMTEAGVKIGSVNMNVAAVSKTVKVTYDGKSAQFNIKVKDAGGKVTFEGNYADATSVIEKYEKNKAIIRPENPARAGYTFENWYTDKDCTVLYDFNKVNSGDLTVYAGWKQDGKTYADFTYDLNYYGVATQTYTQVVASGESSRNLGLTPTRAEFKFDGWYKEAECINAYTQGAVSVDTTVYAKWTKTKSGSSTYKFEGENCDMSSQEGPGLSGSAGGGAMMVSAKNEGVSGKVVSYLYKEGIHVDFAVASNEDATATLKVYVCAEFDINLNSSMYKFMLINSGNPDGKELDYAATQLVAEGPVKCITVQNVQLKKGENVISLVTANSANPTGVEGSGTYKGTAPMIDYIELETEAVVIWDATKGLPMQN